MRQRAYVKGLMLASMLAGCTGAEPMAGSSAGEVGTRGLSQAQQPVSAQSGPMGQSVAQQATFPQKFNVQGPETQVFGFAVTQPGPMVVDVQGLGAPVIVTLQSSGGQPTAQQAIGNLRLNYNVTPQDVQKSLFWTVQIRLAQPMPAQQGGRATGSLNVQCPPVNPTAVQQALQAAAAQRRQPTDQDQAQAAAHAKAQMDAAFQAHKAQLEQHQQQRRAALMAAVQPLLAQMQTQTQAGAAVRPRGVEDTPASDSASAPGEDETSRAIRSRGVEGPSTNETPPASGEDVTTRGTFSGSALRLSPTMVMPNPAIASACVSGQTPCVTKGQPGDPVMITGSGFGSGGEVHFVIGSGKDVSAPAGTVWTDTQIFTSVPDGTGLLAFNGQVYIKRTSDLRLSNLVGFRFEPLMEVRQITATSDRRLQGPVWQSSPPNRIQHSRDGADFLFTSNGNDELFIQTRLKNTWMIDRADVFCEPSYCNGGAYALTTYPGTDWPYLNVRWWLNPDAPFYNFSHVYYQFAVRIVGPKGVPDGVVVP